jgi:hypothetical protein
MSTAVASFDLVTWVALVGTWVLVVGTLAFSYWQLRQNQRLHSASTLLDLRERYYGPRMRQARQVLSRWLLATPRGEEPEEWEVGIYFELLGSLTRDRVLELRMVWNAFGPFVTSYYVFLTEPDDLVAKWRREGNDPTTFADFEWLAKQFSELDRRAGPRAGTPSSTREDARYILEREARAPIDSDGRGPPPQGTT